MDYFFKDIIVGGKPPEVHQVVFSHPCCGFMFVQMHGFPYKRTPVAMKSELKLGVVPLHVLYHALEAVTAIALVVCFTVLMRSVMTGKGRDLLKFIPFIVMAVLDCAVFLIGGLSEGGELNTFAMIFAVAAVPVFVLGKILFRNKEESK